MQRFSFPPVTGVTGKIVLLALFALLQLKSIAGDGDGDKKNTIKKDSAYVNDKGFKSLFINSNYDATMPFAAQLNPKVVSFVEDYIQRYGKSLQKMQDWGRPYFDLYDAILPLNNIPKELKYLSVIESYLKSGIRSRAGAVGPWQIMPTEARRLGLIVTKKLDERKDFAKSTYAAGKMLKELYAEFNDWLLVVAAYNAGPGRIRQAIRKSGSREFWDLQQFLPLETRNHVKKFIATHFLMEGGAGLVTMTASETAVHKANMEVAGTLTETEKIGMETLPVSGRYKSGVMAKQLQMDAAAFNKYNPGFDVALAEGKEYTLRLPLDKMLLFKEKKQVIVQESVQQLLAGR
jgi:membrane-bound lytic murein transglycosylase D